MPKYKFPLEAQDDYKGAIYFTQIIEIPPTLDTSAFARDEGEGEKGIFDYVVDIGDLFGSTFNSGSVSRGDTVQLYLPPAQTVQDGVEFDNTFSFGIGGEAARQGLTNGDASLAGAAFNAITGGGAIGEILNNLQDPDIARLAAVGSMKRLGAKAQGVASSVTQTAINPNIRAIFKSVRPREHSFNFKFLPRSMDEAQEVANIIKWFRTEIYPETINVNVRGQNLPVGYKFPNKFGIAMRYGNKDVGARILPCYLRGMTTNYNATTMAFFRDGQFSEIDLTLDMIESRTLDKDDIKWGFDLYGENFKDFWEELWSIIYPSNTTTNEPNNSTNNGGTGPY